ncbi:hypothetical protein LEP1GSC080_0808 [Leptospira interrogans str. FPW2026]|uniref:hypothetical protein n=1 Tax=Leptospira interrogans TaxID=173 RepID=UPI00027864CF|nr:hypothetical protein [Leptospira interrogans]EJP13117.1 hypothetical protein LEP1GSC080_0808 [Leptospira interrogans str. FPW2026]
MITEFVERPILMSGKLVCETLYGRKTQTRRTSNLKSINENLNKWEFLETIHEHTNLGTYFSALFISKESGNSKLVRCPYGSIGDLLWVKETWRVGAWDVPTKSIAVDYRADNFARQEWIQILDESRFEKLVEQSIIDVEEAGLIGFALQEFKKNFTREFSASGISLESPCRWRPSLFMPKEISRIKLEIKDIRIERLVTISEEDARAEGVEIDSEECDHVRYSCSDIGCLGQTYKSGFAKLWIELHGHNAWSINPWVWVIDYQTWEDELPY